MPVTYTPKAIIRTLTAICNGINPEIKADSLGDDTTVTEYSLPESTLFRVLVLTPGNQTNVDFFCEDMKIDSVWDIALRLDIACHHTLNITIDD